MANVILSREPVDSDLFAGAGGASFGHTKALMKAGFSRADLVAVNHDKAALATHKRNFPWATHHCEDIKRVDPRVALQGKQARHLIGAPDCSEFSNGKGGGMMNEGVRSLALDVQRWARLTQPDTILIENVKGFAKWGPIYPENYHIEKLRCRPIPERKGEYFQSYIKGLEALGYVVDWRLLRACDYGDPTSRVRLFIQAQRDRITWPAPTHGDPGNLFGLPAHKTAWDIIDWELDPGESIFTRKKPLCEKTMARIAEGIHQLTGDPFLIGIGGPTGRQTVRPLDKPFHTVLQQCHDYIVQPFVVVARTGCGALPLDKPLPTICAGTNHFALCTPFLVRYNDGGRVEHLNKPLTTVDTSNRFGLVQAFLINYYGNGRALPLTEPLPTVTTRDRFGLVEVERALSEKGLILVDVRMRMLAAHELIAAHSQQEMIFEGTDTQIKAQVGHSWPAQLAEKVCYSMITGREGLPA